MLSTFRSDALIANLVQRTSIGELQSKTLSNTMFGLPASNLLWWANEIRIWASAVAALAALVTFAASYAQIRLQSIVSAAKDEAFNEFRLASEERIATAQENAAAAHERAANLEKEANQARLEQERLKVGLAWRQIQPTAGEQLKNALQSQPGAVTVAYPANDPEAIFYAEQFGRILKEAGWQIRGEARSYSAGSMFGISIPFKVGSSNVPTLQAAFETAGIAYKTNPVPDPEMYMGSAPGPSDAALLFVGSKPPPF